MKHLFYPALHIHALFAPRDIIAFASPTSCIYTCSCQAANCDRKVCAHSHEKISSRKVREKNETELWEGAAALNEQCRSVGADKCVKIWVKNVQCQALGPRPVSFRAETTKRACFLSGLKCLFHCAISCISPFQICQKDINRRHPPPKCRRIAKIKKNAHPTSIELTKLTNFCF